MGGGVPVQPVSRAHDKHGGEGDRAGLDASAQFVDPLAQNPRLGPRGGRRVWGETPG